MKILIDLTALSNHLSGIERFAMSIAQEMIRDDSHQFILLFRNGIHPAFERTGPHVRKIVLKGNRKLWFYQVTLPLRLFCLRADHYLFPAFPAPFLFCSRKTVNVLHDGSVWDCPEGNKWYMSLYFRILCRKAALNRKQLVTVSRFSRQRLSLALHRSPESIEVIHNGLAAHLEQFEYDAALHRQAADAYQLPGNYVLCLSTLEPKKNLRLLVTAYDQLLQEGRLACDLVLAGRKGWKMDDLLRNVHPGTLARIHMTGFVEDEHLPYLYRDARLFVFPSTYEGFGMPPVEAMAMGAPVLRVYEPIARHAAVYDSLYAEYKLLHDYFGRGGNDVMKRLKRLKAAAGQEV